MSEQIAFNIHRDIFTAEDARSLPPDMPYIDYISYSGWTDGHHHMMHKHDDIAEVMLIIKGSGAYYVGAKLYQISSGDIVLCGGGVLHDEFPQTDELYQTLSLGIRNLKLPDTPPNQFFNGNVLPIFYQPEQFHDMETLFCMIERHAAEEKAGYKMLCQNLMLGALELIKRMLQSRTELSVNESDTICTRIENFLNEHYADEISIDMLGQMFYISPYHLSHIFKHETGYSVRQYILRRRIGEAQSRLVNTKDTVQHIANDVGFDDANYFSRLFTKYVGMSPVAYRNYRKGAK